MATIVASLSCFCLPHPRSYGLCSTKKTRRFSVSASSLPPLMDSNSIGTQSSPGFMDFPYVLPPHRALMFDLISTLDSCLGSSLLPASDLPQDLKYVQNPAGTSCASFHHRSGLPSSSIDFIFGGWVHSESPSGEAIEATSLSGYLNTSTDAPNFVFELIQRGPTRVVFILDTYPRTDPVLDPDYVMTFYENTGFEKQRQLLADLPEATPYTSPSLFLRCVLAPTAILAVVETETTERLQEIIGDHISPIVKEVFRAWIHVCALGERPVLGEKEKEVLKKRDRVISAKHMEVDFELFLPELIGKEKAPKVLGHLKEIFRI